jgi:hypothetical protein
MTFDPAHQDRARVALAATICRSQLTELADAGLRLDDEQAADLAGLLAAVSAPKTRKAPKG